MNYLSLIFWIVLCEGVGVVSGIFTSRAVRGWYVTLRKPSFNPPNWVFAPVWTTLYLMMGVAAWIVSQGENSILPLVLFLVQLGLNFFWSVLFFAARRIGLAFLELIVLWGFILLTMVTFFAVSPVAGLLMAPYLLWCTFAGVLNREIARLN